MPHEHGLWIDTLSPRLGLSAWRAVPVLGLGLYLLFIVSYVAAGVPATLAAIAVYGLVFYAPLALGSLAASLYVRDKIVALEGYAMSMVEDPKAASDLLAPLSRLGPVAVLSLGIFLAFVLPYILEPPSGTASSALLLALFPWFFVVWTTATALWILGFSLVGVYRIGKLPMRLQPFTADRTLGLRPFASTTLRLTAVYYLLILFTILSDLEAPVRPEYALARGLGFVLLGVLLFVLPLRSLHERLVRVKAEKLSWINGRYSRIVHEVESKADGPLDPRLQGELLAIDKIQKDVHAIRTWPFDIGSLAKLLTILLSVTAILLSRILASLLGI